MPYESGGRADKLGNKYEFNWIVLKFIDVISEKIDCWAQFVLCAFVKPKCCVMNVRPSICFVSVTF